MFVKIEWWNIVLAIALLWWCEFSFVSQRIDEKIDAAGEDPSQAVEEADPGYNAEEGKPPSKLKLRITLFIFPCIPYIVSC